MTHLPEDLTCRELVELVTDYLEERLPDEARVRFELHLVYCDACRTYVRQVRQVLGAAGGLTEETIPEQPRDALLRTFRGWKRGAGGGDR
jgi:anti-sigma factor RsiW